MTVDEAAITGSSELPATTTTLGRLLDALSDAVIDVVIAPAGFDVPIANAVIHDAHGPTSADRHDLVLGVGVDARSTSALDLIDRVADHGASALVLRIGSEVDEALVDRATSRGLTLLRANRVEWGSLYTLVRTATSAVVTRDRDDLESDDVDSVPLGDLFALANAIASMVDGATTIEDRRLQVLAHSNLGHPVDRVRRDSIVGRRVPDDVRRETEDLYRKVWRSQQAVRLAAHEPTGSRRRLAVAIRAGREVLGTIWAIEGDTPFTEETERTLVEASRLAALHLLRHTAAGDVDRQRRADLARSVLEGRAPLTAIARETGDRTTPCFTFIAFENRPDADEVRFDQAGRRLADVVILHAEAYRRSSAVVRIGPTVYLLLPEPADGSGVRRRELVDEIVRRAGQAIDGEVSAAVGTTVTARGDAQAARREVDDALRVARRSRRPVVYADDVRLQVALLRLCDTMSEDPELRTDLLDRVDAHDRTHGTDYVETLEAYVRAGGHTGRAAGALFVHPNTLRYRLRRLTEETGIDPTDDDTRLLLDLEVRLRTHATSD